VKLKMTYDYKKNRRNFSAVFFSLTKLFLQIEILGKKISVQISGELSFSKVCLQKWWKKINALNT